MGIVISSLVENDEVFEKSDSKKEYIELEEEQKKIEIFPNKQS